MTIPGNANPLLLKSAAAAGGYQIERSLRFNSSDSAYLSRTPGSAGNRKTWTWAGWVKRSYVGATYKMLFSADNGAHSCGFRFTNSPSDTIEFFEYNGGFTWQLVTTQVFRDLSAWYHIVVVFDSTQGTSTNRLKLYVNGTQVTAFGTASYPSPNYDSLINAAVAHNIGAYAGIQNFDGYLADVHFIDGQALTPSSFTEVSATTGQLVPKAYTGTYGTNGFKLTFSDNSATTATTLGKDSAGSNNWTPNNFSVTAGAGNDSLVDTPTSYGTDTGAGGEVRGNYCTLNPLTAGFAGTLSNGNLDYNLGSGTKRSEGTIAVASGKWWWEALAVSGTTNGTVGGRFGFCVQSSLNNPESTAFGLHWHATSGLQTVIAGSFTTRATGTNYTDGDLLACALDADSNIAYFYKNGSLAYTYDFSSHVAVGSGPLTPHVWNASSGTPVWTYNFGQRAWGNTPRTSHKALCDTNLPAPVVAKPNTVMDVKLYTGNGTGQAITGLAFSPDFIWTKSRSRVDNHGLHDIVRGRASNLYSDLTNPENISSAGADLVSFDANGYTLGTVEQTAMNRSGETYVAWTWDAGSSTVTNTQGSITSQVRANVSAGFSVVAFNSGSGAPTAYTVGHGLNVAPQFIIAKSRTSASYNWSVYHTSIATTTNKYLSINSANATADNGTSIWGAAQPTSTVFGITSGNAVVANTDCIAYCFAPVVGYSSMGSYVGNGSADGPFVFCNFRPRWLLVKNATNGGSWVLHDTTRSTYNVSGQELLPDSSGAEYTFTRFDFLSNGFKGRTTNNATNTSNDTYIYAAFAENPFQYARAR